jgi:hypothetical protein
VFQTYDSLKKAIAQSEKDKKGNSKPNDIMRLGGWESLDMVLRYTKSVSSEESLRLYHSISRRPPED